MNSVESPNCTVREPLYGEGEIVMMVGVREVSWAGKRWEGREWEGRSEEFLVRIEHK